MNLALIGAGNWGKNYIKTINTLENIKLKYLVTSNPKNISLLKNSNCKIINNWQELINKDDIDGIIIAVPPNIQAKIAIKLINENIPLLLQKPLALNIEDAKKIKELVKRNNSLVLIDHTYLFHPAYEYLKNKLLYDNSINFIDSKGCNYGPFRKNIPVLWDWGPHDLYMCLDLINDFPKIIDVKKTSLNSREINGELITVDMEFSKHTKTTSTFGNIHKPKERYLKIHTDKGIIIFDDCSNNSLILKDKDKDKIYKVNDEPPLNRVIKYFINGLKGKIGRRFGVNLGFDVVNAISNIDDFIFSNSLDIR